MKRIFTDGVRRLARQVGQRLAPRVAPPPDRQLSFAFDFGAFAAPITPPADPDRPRARRVVIGGQPCDYHLRRSRRRTIGFQIDDRGLTVSAPRWVAVRDVEAAILDKERWIHGKLTEWRQWRARRRLPQVRFADGGSLPYLGEMLTLRLRPDLRASRLEEGPAPEGTPLGDWDGAPDPATRRELRLALPADASEEQVRDAVQSWLKAQARETLGERLELLARQGGVKFSSWTLSSARSQWGSCTAGGVIRLNWRLVHFALPVIDYVVAHELAHLREMNHGPRFWQQVGVLLPGFEAAREQIRQEDLGSLPL